MRSPASGKKRNNPSFCSDFNRCTAAKQKKISSNLLNCCQVLGHFHDFLAGIFECSNQSFNIFLNCGAGFATMARYVRKGLCVTLCVSELFKVVGCATNGALMRHFFRSEFENAGDIIY